MCAREHENGNCKLHAVSLHNIFAVCACALWNASNNSYNTDASIYSVVYAIGWENLYISGSQYDKQIAQPKIAALLKKKQKYKWNDH